MQSGGKNVKFCISPTSVCLTLQQTPALCIFLAGMFQETHLTINDGPSPGDFVMAADPVVDGLSWLSQVNLGGGTQK